MAMKVKTKLDASKLTTVLEAVKVLAGLLADPEFIAAAVKVEAEIVEERRGGWNRGRSVTYLDADESDEVE